MTRCAALHAGGHTHTTPTSQPIVVRDFDLNCMHTYVHAKTEHSEVLNRVGLPQDTYMHILCFTVVWC